MSQVLEANDSNFDAEVLKASGPVLVDFSATWCGPCKKLDPIVREIAGDYAGRLKVVKVDVDRAPGTAAKFGVMSVPTVLLVRDGAVRDQLIGLVSKQALADRVDKVL
ncbi:MAG TPA: thioredoxin [Candidatus Polarisedimenticolaceae bacterium]|nr:thioredoxin [Candidatus Polarisedimenticolaceae bacterium]